MTESNVVKKVDEILSRGVGTYVDPDRRFREKVIKKAEGSYPNDIIIKFGIDPTRPDIHLGHAVIFRKLRQLQDLGCTVVFLVGDYTAQIGDPSGRSKTRPEIEQKQVEENARTYIDQAGHILDTDSKKLSWIRNSDWFVSPLDVNLPKDYEMPYHLHEDKEDTTKDITPQSFLGKTIAWEKTRMQPKIARDGRIHFVTMRNILWSLKHITHSRLVKRDMFQKRLQDGEELYMHEMLYPIFQGIDSYIINEIYGSCDLEIGGTDQEFNMLLGRDLQEKNRNALETHNKSTELQAVLTCSLLEGTDGTEKMSKSADNYIAITEPPEEMYGKVMSVPDTLMRRYFELCTFTPLGEVDDIMDKIKNDQLHPRDGKMRLAREIVSTYHGEKQAREAEEAFTRTFADKEVPDDVPEVSASSGSALVDILREHDLVSSKSEFRRLVNEGAIRIATDDGWHSVTDPEATAESGVYRIGKKRFIRIRATQ